MFDIGWGELVVIGIVALIAIGPKELPTVLRTLGQYMGKVRRMASEFQGQFQEALREAEFADLKKHAEDIKESVSGLSNFDPLADTQKEIESAFSADPTKSDSPKQEAVSDSSGGSADAMTAALPISDVATAEQPAAAPEKHLEPAEAPAKQAGDAA
ncbi:MAG TPA: Sec-independent protein translocase protein TatB [Pseudolabrys sp.]|nr:Sec-independent protein translocase protein TatB [Pseudolabrys sp.]